MHAVALFIIKGIFNNFCSKVRNYRRLETIEKRERHHRPIEVLHVYSAPLVFLAQHAPTCRRESFVDLLYRLCSTFAVHAATFIGQQIMKRPVRCRQPRMTYRILLTKDSYVRTPTQFFIILVHSQIAS